MGSNQNKKYTLSGGFPPLKGTTLLDPLGLSWLPVMPLSHKATISDDTSSGWTRVVSSGLEYNHIG